MRSTSLCLAIFIFFFNPTLAIAQNKNDAIIKDLISKAESAYNSCDSEAIIAFYDPNSMIFNTEGPLANFDPQEVRGFCANGGVYDFKFEVFMVRANGDTGVALIYNKGSVTPPNAAPIPVNDRITAIWGYNGEEWLIVHLHMSPIGNGQ